MVLVDTACICACLVLLQQQSQICLGGHLQDHGHNTLCQSGQTQGTVTSSGACSSKAVGSLERIQKRAMVKGRRTHPVWKDWSSCISTTWRTQGCRDLVTVLQYLNDRILQKGWRLPLHRCQTERTRGNGYKLKWQRFHTDRRRHVIFSVRAFIHCNNLLWDMVKSPFLKIFKMQLKRVVDIFI